MIPDKHRHEWEALVTGNLKPTFNNFILQMKVTQAIKDVRLGKSSIQDAIEELHNLCTKYEKAVNQDIKTIFESHL